MRLLPLALTGLVAGCGGNVADFVGPRAGIIERELPRYSLNLRQSRCVAEQLGSSVSPRRLREFERLAATVRAGYFEPERLTMRDLMHIAGTMSDPQVRVALARAASICDATPGLVTRREPAAQPQVASPARPATWLNLGSAPSGQGIAVDAASVEREANAGRAWFRLINPASPPTGISYLLRIECTARTIAAVARRTHDSAGAVTEYREYGPPDSNPLPVEAGTVMQIAFLSMCS